MKSWKRKWKMEKGCRLIGYSARRRLQVLVATSLRFCQWISAIRPITTSRRFYTHYLIILTTCHEYPDPHAACKVWQDTYAPRAESTLLPWQDFRRFDHTQRRHRNTLLRPQRYTCFSNPCPVGLSNNDHARGSWQNKRILSHHARFAMRLYK